MLGWLLWLVFMGGFIALGIVARKYGRRDVFAWLNSRSAGPLPPAGRSVVSRLVDEITCAILGPPEAHHPGHIVLTPQQVVFVYTPIFLLTLVLHALVETTYAFFLALAVYAALVAGLASAERVIEGPGTFTRPRRPGPLSPAVFGIACMFDIAFAAWLLSYWLRGLTSA